MRRVVITGPPPVQILDVTGPLEVFSNAPGYDIQLLAPDGLTSLRTNRGIDLGNALPLAACTGPIDTLIIAGGPGAESGTYDQKFVRWIADAAGREELDVISGGI